MISQTEVYKTLLVMVAGFIGLHFLFGKNDVFLYIGGGVGAVGFLFPVLGEWIVWVWYKIGEGLGWVNSKILLSVVYFVFFFPIAVLSKLGSKDPLRLKKPEDTVFVERNHKFEGKDMKNIW